MGSVRLPEGTIRRLAAEGRLPAGVRAVFSAPPLGASSGPKRLTRDEDFTATLALDCERAGIPPVREHGFHPVRMWRLDLAWPDRMVACEVDGGVYVEGRHTSGAGFEADCEKLSEAAALGWRVLRVTPRHVKDGRALGWLERALRV